MKNFYTYSAQSIRKDNHMAFDWFKKEKNQKHKDRPLLIPGEKDCENTDSKRITAAESPGFLKRLKSGLTKTRENLAGGLEKIFSGKKKIDAHLLEELEELLITADIGFQTTVDLIETISKTSSAISSAIQLKDVLKNEIISILETSRQPVLPESSGKPHIVMIVGVNGVGKTTTIGKLAAKSVAANQKVLIAAADTFRAAAIEQLEIWAQRAGADIVKHKDNADPSAVVFDSIDAAVARKSDIVFIDTAGRLHTKINLMEELKKIKRTITNKLPAAPHEILLVLDATTGQNALSQVKLFNETLDISGLVVTKLDGTAKGGVVIGISKSLNIPIQYIGIGEKIEDLQVFNPRQFVDALF
ncbi:signal recognition particle-docking protein FtsY [Thermodesulfobacteriota bacterium]